MKNEIMLNNNDLKIYSSVKANTVEEKKAVYNALEKCDVLLNDIVGTEINIKDFYIEERQREEEDESTGEVKQITKYRTILFDMDGKTYATGSYGVYNALRRICMVYGEPTWTEGVMVKVDKKPMGNGKTQLTLVLV
ncbi:MAG: hypothetical protein VZR33_05730 [Methanosphaera sp.]|nr:hypothetical protein [Methanosphaera sp.]